MRNKRFDHVLLTLLVFLVVWYIVFLYTRKSDQPIASGIIGLSDTIQPIIISGSTCQTFPLIFDAAFVNGTIVKQGQESISFRRLDLGKMKIESGKILVCDDVNISQRIPFTEQFPTGEFPCEVSLVNLGGYECVAFCRIRFSDDSIARWEFALLPGQEPIELTDSLSYFYPVDAGIALFIDSAANDVLGRSGTTGWNNAFITPWINKSYTAYIHNFEGHNMAVFSSGGGDGRYSAYIGYNILNEPCCLLTDFAYVYWWNCK